MKPTPTTIARNSALLGVLALLLVSTIPPPRIDATPVAATTYRPQYHHIVPDRWMNDPQRPIYLNGQFHYYYLYNSDYPNTNHTAWRRSTSTDLVQFTDRGDAVPKDTTPNGSIWSGSPVIDANNTAGFGANAVVVLATQAHATNNNAQAQFLWYSTDGGATFRNYSSTPVIPNPGRVDFRDPKTIWDADRNRWVTVLAENDQLSFYTSTNLRTWQRAGEWRMPGLGVLECPDLFRMVADDGTTKWVIGASANGKAIGQPNTYAYWTGTFTGAGFQQDTTHQWLDYGWDWYAAVTWENPTNPQGSRYGIGWMNNWDYSANTPTWANDGFNGTNSIVREIRLKRQSTGGYSLVSQPVNGLNNIVAGTTNLGTVQVNGIVPLTFTGEAYELTTDISWSQLNNVGLQLRKSADGTRHADVGVYGDYAYLNRGYTNHPDHTNRFLESKSPYDPARKNVRLRILVDRTTIEMFVDDGKYVHSSQVFGAPGDNGIALYTDGGAATFANLTIRTLRNINALPIPSGTVLANFENNTYGSWTRTGTAFGTAPATGTLPNQQHVSGYLGDGLVNTYLNGDATTGTLTSPTFTINQRYLKFLLGGGNHPNTTGTPTTVNLVVGGQVVRTATGRNEEYLRWTTWDLSNLNGRTAQIQIVDNNTGGWGHINADHFTLTATA
ncbi:GH32 C-terminal domain-containing protein [Micromonospora sp. CPCC 205371]|nr:GH32 C-terminal domain-containing protein [Micromonospora sp. CPCC 205371]